jgi:microcystin-dependent protein
MRMKVYTIEVAASPIAKRWLLRGAVLVVFLSAVATIAFAATPVPKIWVANDQLKAADLNANFQAVATPAGVVMAFAGTAVPSGYLLCDGRAVSRTTYPDLFAAIGTGFGSGDGSTTFDLPDFRGRFLRGVDGAANRDPETSARTAAKAGGNAGNLVGSIQADQFAAHTHNGYFYDVAGAGGTMFATGQQARSLGNPYGLMGSAGGTETRPINIYVNYIIKI